MQHPNRIFSLFLAAAISACGQNSAPPAKETVNSAPAPVQRGRLASAAQRNENVPIYQIDNNAIKEANIRLGVSITSIAEATPDRNWYSTEFGRPPGPLLLMPPAAALPAWHAELFEWHQNSVFNARTFFQVGPVKPSRRNHYGGRFTTPLASRLHLSADASQRKVRGMVNGNVLVPLPAERTPRATDPAARALIGRFLLAFPNEYPNRPDFDPRALNTNAAQNIDNVDGTLRLDFDAGQAGRFSLSHNLSRQHVDAFQLVAGMNPDTDIHAHRSQLSWRQSPSALTDLAAGFTFQRTRSLLLPEPNAAGPRVRFGFQIQELGPDPEFPVDRALNTFRGGAQAARRVSGGRHALQFGADFTRTQLNSIESSNMRGFLSFASTPQHTAIENFLLGIPAFYEQAIGNFSRGFRNWSGQLYFGDRWQAHPRLSLSYGLRYEFLTRPLEVDNLDQVPYGCDCNNLGPRFALAWQAGRGWLLRSSYAISFNGIPPVTYQQVRNNQPLVRFVQVQNPDLLNPLRDFDLSKPGRSSATLISPDLVSPYAHHYNFNLERKVLSGGTLRLSYIGSRGVKLLTNYIMNRADPSPVYPLTLKTVDDRRPDPRYFEVLHIVNGGLAYFNAGQASIDLPAHRGFRATVSYTFSKAMDEGADYSGTAANSDVTKGRSQYQYNALGDRRSLSTFDSPHALLLNWTYDLPRLSRTPGVLSSLLNGWQLAGVVLAKSGTPFTLYVGSDAPGFGNVDGGPGDRPNIIDPSILGRTVGHPDTAPDILRRDRFAFVTPGDPRGSVARNAFRKARIGNFNASLSKIWQWGGTREWTAILRGEAYNLTNTPQFDEAQRNLSSPSFGRITNTLNDGRVFQLGLRLIL